MYSQFPIRLVPMPYPMGGIPGTAPQMMQAVPPFFVPNKPNMVTPPGKLPILPQFPFAPMFPMQPPMRNIPQPAYPVPVSSGTSAAALSLAQMSKTISPAASPPKPIRPKKIVPQLSPMPVRSMSKSHQKKWRYWHADEHRRFLEAILLVCNPVDYAGISRYVGSRSSYQCRSHAQKYYRKLARTQPITKMSAPFDYKELLNLLKDLYRFFPDQSEKHSIDYSLVAASFKTRRSANALKRMHLFMLQELDKEVHTLRGQKYMKKDGRVASDDRESMGQYSLYSIDGSLSGTSSTALESSE